MNSKRSPLSRSKIPSFPLPQQSPKKPYRNFQLSPSHKKSPIRISTNQSQIQVQTNRISATSQMADNYSKDLKQGKTNIQLQTIFKQVCCPNCRFLFKIIKQEYASGISKRHSKQNDKKDSSLKQKHYGNKNVQTQDKIYWQKLNYTSKQTQTIVMSLGKNINIYEDPVISNNSNNLKIGSSKIPSNNNKNKSNNSYENLDVIKRLSRNSNISNYQQANKKSFSPITKNSRLNSYSPDLNSKNIDFQLNISSIIYDNPQQTPHPFYNIKFPQNNQPYQSFYQSNHQNLQHEQDNQIDVFQSFKPGNNNCKNIIKKYSIILKKNEIEPILQKLQQLKILKSALKQPPFSLIDMPSYLKKILNSINDIQHHNILRGKSIEIQNWKKIIV